MFEPLTRHGRYVDEIIGAVGACLTRTHHGHLVLAARRDLLGDRLEHHLGAAGEPVQAGKRE